MRRHVSVLTLSFALVFMIGCSDVTGPEPSASDGDAVATAAHGRGVENFVAPLSGDEVVPSVDTDAQGLAKFKLNKAGDALSFKLNVANIEDVVGAHIHNAPAGENGGIVVFLFGEPFTDAVTVNGTLVQGTITASDVVGSIAGDFEALIDLMKSGDTYVQVHTVANLPGEIRGQIDRGNGVNSAPSF